MTLKDKSVLIYDYGLCPEVALKLAESFGRVYYFTQWQEAFPSSNKAMIGRGLEKFGVEKIDYFWDKVDSVDLIACFDTYSHDVVEFLKTKGYRVFGPGLAEFLENNRKYCLEIQEAVGLPVPEAEAVVGITNLKKKIIEMGGNVYVKLNSFRGDMETFYVKDILGSKIYLDRLSVSLGPRQEQVEFLVSKKINGIEPGYDGFVVDGKYPNYGLWGYERKGSGYITKVEKYENIPLAIKQVNDKLSKYFETMKTRSMFSTEIMVDASGDGYLIDPTIRSPMPVPTAIQLELWQNFAEFIWEASAGNLIDLIPTAKYGCGVALDSEWANKNWLEVLIDKEVRRWVKFRNFIIVNDKYYAVPGFSSVCSVIGLGDSVDEAIEHLKENIAGVSGFELDQDIGGIENVIEEIQQGSDFGLPDFSEEE